MFQNTPMNKLKFKEEYQKLNPNQKQAVDSLEGPIMVIAGPGTGKTQVLSLRITNLILKGKAKPNEILALTFSESATNSMQKRLVEFLGTTAYEITVNTFHGFCNEIIKANPEIFNFKENLEKIDDLAKSKLLKTIIKETKLKHLKPFGDPFFHKNEILAKISNLKKEGISFEKFSKIVQKIKALILAKKEDEINPKTNKPKGIWQKELKNVEKLEDFLLIYEKYQAGLLRLGFYDYDDMIVWVIDEMAKNETLRSDYQEKYQYILCDEYQDTNSSQNRILKILNQDKTRANIFVVGDDDQSIYRFQGANLANILNFEKNYPKIKVIPININYRSLDFIVKNSRNIIEKANLRLVNQSSQSINKDLTANQAREEAQSDKIKILEFSNQEIENYFLVKKIQELKQKGIDYNEIAIILRTNQEVEQIGELLLKAEIPLEMDLVKSVLEEKEINDFLNLLKLVIKPKDNLNLYRVLSLPIFGINKKDFFQFLSEFQGKNFKAKNQIKNLFEKFELLNKPENQENLANYLDFEKFKNFFDSLLAWYQASFNQPASVLFEKILRESQFLDSVLKRKDYQLLNQISALYNFFKNRTKQNPNLSLKAILADIELMKEENLKIKPKKLSLASSQVKVMTAHRSKGMEFKAVFIPYLYRGNWDGKRVSQNIKFPKQITEIFEKGDFLDNQNHLEQANNLSLLEYPFFEDPSSHSKQDDERRLFYVALTRAKQKVYLSRSEKYELYNEVKEKPPSIFLEEIKASDASNYQIIDPKLYENDFKARTVLNLKSEPEILSDEEKDFLLKKIENLSLSPTSLNIYLGCPKRFKLEKLFMIPKAKSKILSLGTAIHTALEDFFRLFMEENKIDQKILIKSFKQALEEEILSKEDFKDILTEGQAILKDYFDFYKDKLVKPIKLETSFSKVFLDEVRLTGKVDKIEQISLKDVVVTDYKTMVPKSINEVKGLTKNSNGDIYRQLIFYKLLSVLDKNFKYKVKTTQIDFVKPKKYDLDKKFVKLNFEITQKEVQDLKKLIKEVIQKIRNLEFPEAENKKNCKYCDYKDLC
jgi:DNA helicase-2/ATP-dependent DNA helicase PcrA